MREETNRGGQSAMTTNGNLSLDARRQLHSGAVVAWKTEWMLAEQVGTVDKVGDLGSLILCDGARVCQDDYCRLVKADENSILAVESSRYCHGEAAGMAREPQDAPADENPSEIRQGQKPAAKGQQTAFAKRPSKCKGVPLKDHALWLRAVNAIHDRMGAGMYREAAVAQVAALPEYGSLRITVAKYPWWARKFKAQGLVTRSFVGGTNHPKGKAAGNKAGGALSLAAETLQSTRVALIATCPVCYRVRAFSLYELPRQADERYRDWGVWAERGLVVLSMDNPGAGVIRGQPHTDWCTWQQNETTHGPR